MSGDPDERDYWARALRQVLRRTRGNPDAEDLLHSAYIRLEAYRAKHSVESPVGFLVRTAANIGVDEHRRSARHAADGDAQMLDLADEGPLADEVLVARERLGRAKLGLEKMPARRREIFLMNRIDGLTYRQIAGRIGLSQSMVEKEMAKAILFLADWMAGW